MSCFLMLYVYAELSALPPSQSAAHHLMMSFSLQYCFSKDRTSFYSVPKKKYSNQENFGLRMIFYQPAQPQNGGE